GARWLEIDPRDPHALYQYGHACVLQRRYGEADRAYGLSATFGPRNPIPWSYRAWLQVLWHGDVEKARGILAEARKVDGIDDEQSWLTYRTFSVALLRRDYEGALEILRAEKRDTLVSQFYYNPIALLRGQALSFQGRHEEARSSFEEARGVLEPLVAKDPGDFRYQGALAVACAGLGLRDEALTAAKRGVELMPFSKDAWRARWPLDSLA